jgi:hypothetical protein
MSMSDKIKDFGWFGAAWAVFKGGTKDSDFYPSLNDMEAQRQWLGGFGAAWSECPDEEAIESILHGDGRGGGVGGRCPGPDAGGERGAAAAASGASCG